jgi:hypothetical protein
MTARYQEVRSSALQYPLTLLPIAIGADLVARLAGGASVRAATRRIAPFVAGAAVAASTRNLLARNVERKIGAPEHDAAGVDRTMSLVASAVVATVIASWPVRRPVPRTARFALAVGTVGLASYFAFASRRPPERRGDPSAPGNPSGAAPHLHRPEVAAAVRTAAGDSLRGL